MDMMTHARIIILKRSSWFQLSKATNGQKNDPAEESTPLPRPGERLKRPGLIG